MIGKRILSFKRRSLCRSDFASKQEVTKVVSLIKMTKSTKCFIYKDIDKETIQQQQQQQHNNNNNNNDFFFFEDNISSTRLFKHMNLITN